MGELIIGTENNGFEATDEIVVTIAWLFEAYCRLGGGPAFLVSYFPDDRRDDAGVSIRFAMYHPRLRGGDVLRTQAHGDDVDIDPEYAERARQCMEHTGGWLVLDASDEVVTDAARAKEVVAMAISGD